VGLTPYKHRKQQNDKETVDKTQTNNTNKMKKLYYPIAIGLCASSLSLSAVAQGAFGVPYNQPGIPLPDEYADTLQANGGDVSVTYMHGISGGDLDILSLNGVPIFNNQVNTPGDVVDLGIFPAGTTLNFTLQDVTAEHNWSMGPGSVNSDGFVHAYVANNYPSDGSSYVGWEDETWGDAYADFNYNDLSFTFANTTAVPEPSSMVLAGFGLASMLILRRRRQA
jgi:hypothetical protein